MYTRSTIRASKGDTALHARHTPERPRGYEHHYKKDVRVYTGAHGDSVRCSQPLSAAAGDAKEGSAPANFYVLCARAIPIPGCGGISVFRTVCSHGTRSAGAGVAREGDGDGDGGREYASDDERDSEETGDGGGGDGTEGVGDNVVRKGYGDGGGDGSPSDALAVTEGALTTSEGAVVGPEVEPGERSVRLDGRRCCSQRSTHQCRTPRRRACRRSTAWGRGRSVCTVRGQSSRSLCGSACWRRRIGGSGAGQSGARSGNREGMKVAHHSSQGRSAGWARGSQTNPRVVHSTHRMSSSLTSQRTDECRVAMMSMTRRISSGHRGREVAPLRLEHCRQARRLRRSTVAIMGIGGGGGWAEEGRG